MAPPPNGAAHYVLIGSGPGAEIWQTGWWATLPSIADQAALKTAVEAAAPDVTTLWTAIKASIGGGYSLNELRAYWYDGTSNDAVFNASHAFTGLVGTQAGSGSPLDTCRVVTLLTGQSGATHRGRMYFPWHEICSPTTGLFGSDGSSFLGAVQAFLNNVQAHGAGDVVIVSRKLGTTEGVTAIRTDQRPDVQRRRVNRLSRGILQTLTTS